MNAAVAKGQVGIVGLGIMGGAIAKNPERRRLAGDRLSRLMGGCAEAKAAGVEIAAGAAAVATKAANILVSLPKPRSALSETVEAIVAVKSSRRVIAELHLLARRQGDGRGAIARGRSRDARLPAERHRSQARNPKRPGGLCERRRAGDQRADAGVRGFLAPGA
jgi:hypothetical protein